MQIYIAFNLDLQYVLYFLFLAFYLLPFFLFVTVLSTIMFLSLLKFVNLSRATEKKKQDKRQKITSKKQKVNTAL